jgi:ubiquinone biosynthesis protein
VVVKVQRPDIRRQIADDFEVLAEIASFLDEHTEIGRRYRFSAVVADFRATIQQELNYEREAQNLIAVGKNLKEFKLIQVPQPILDFSTRSVLTMEYIKGRRSPTSGPRGQARHQGAPLAEELFRAYLKQVLVDGLFHADPHPGNVFITDDGRIALLDLGMVGPGRPGDAGASPQGPHRGQRREGRRGRRGGRADEREVGRLRSRMKFRQQIGQLVASSRNQGLKELNVGQSLLDVSRHARENGCSFRANLSFSARPSSSWTRWGASWIPPSIPNASIRRNAARSYLEARMGRETSPGHLIGSLLEMKDFTVHLPVAAEPDHGRDLQRRAGGEGEGAGRKDGRGRDREGGQPVTKGILLAALIIGAALMMRIETHWHLFGYPGFAMLCFLAAAVGALTLLYNIYAEDRDSRKHRPH